MDPQGSVHVFALGREIARKFTVPVELREAEAGPCRSC
jgi:hypothetical protein